MVAEPENDDAKRKREEKAMAEQLTEDMGLPPAKRTAQQGIADMKALILTLEEELAGFLQKAEAIHGDEAWSEYVTKKVTGLRLELLKARSRLAEYQTQLEGLN